MTMPLPARAENTKPALNMVKIAKPLAFSRMDLGMTPSRPLLVPSTKDLTKVVGQKGDDGADFLRTYGSGLFAFLWERLGKGAVEFHGGGYKSTYLI